MDFNELNEYIPYVVGGKPKVLTMTPYKGIELAMPGKHAKETTPVGGDFVVRVTDPNIKWRKHEFSHNDIFAYVEGMGPEQNLMLMQIYNDIVVHGMNADDYAGVVYDGDLLHPRLFFYALQALAVAEHRRYAKYEIKFGGRYLPFRFAAGIAEGLWTAGEAAANQKRGRPGVEYLEHLKGVPILTKELMK